MVAGNPARTLRRRRLTLCLPTDASAKIQNQEVHETPPRLATPTPRDRDADWAPAEPWLLPSGTLREDLFNKRSRNAARSSLAAHLPTLRQEARYSKFRLPTPSPLSNCLNMSTIRARLHFHVCVCVWHAGPHCIATHNAECGMCMRSPPPCGRSLPLARNAKRGQAREKVAAEDAPARRWDTPGRALTNKSSSVGLLWRSRCAQLAVAPGMLRAPWLLHTRGCLGDSPVRAVGLVTIARILACGVDHARSLLFLGEVRAHRGQRRVLQRSFPRAFRRPMAQL